MNQPEIIEAFSAVFGSVPQIVSRAPGRVNLLGEHTDYNDGFVFPTDIDRAIWIGARLNKGNMVHAHSLAFQQSCIFRLDSLVRDPEAPWTNYIKGVLHEYQKRGDTVRGMDLIVGGDVPMGSGLSSSAAMEVATAETVRVLSEIDIDPVEMALLSQAAERNFAGVQCGIMDQFVSVLGKRDSALFLDCRDLSFRNVPLEMNARIVICDSRKERSLAASAYNNRRAECEAAARIMDGVLGNVTALRDVLPEELERHSALLSPVQYKRARHVVTENARVLAGVAKLQAQDIDAFGRLMYASHTSLRDDYEVSCEELDVLVDLARNHPGTIGARMTGAGFGGCTVNLVNDTEVEDFTARVREGYQARTGIEPYVYVCIPSDGVSHQILG